MNIRITKPRDPSGIAEAWHRMYREHVDNPASTYETVRGKPGDTYAKLLAFGPSITREQAEQTIGNKSWTRYSCSSCREYGDRMAEIGDDPSLYVCRPCLTASLAALEAVIEATT